MQVVKATRHEIHASPWLSRRARLAIQNLVEIETSGFECHKSGKHIRGNDYICAIRDI